VHPALKQCRERRRHFGSVDAENAAELRRVVIGFGLVEVDDVVAEIREFLRQPQLGFAAPQALVGELARRDVVDEADEPRRLDAPHLADRELAREDGAVLASRLHFAADPDDPGFAGPLVMLHVRVMVGAIGRGHEHVDVLANHLGCGVTEGPLGGEAELFDQALMIDDDDRVNRRVQQRPELELGLVRASGRGAGRGVLGGNGLAFFGQDLRELR